MREHDKDEFWMNLALAEAQQAANKGEVPVGAVIIANGTAIARAGNSSIHNHDPSAHAEIQALRIACRHKQNYRIPEATLYVTLEPCIMCMGAIIHARIKRLVYGAADPKTGAVASLYSLGNDSRLNHQPEICSGVLARECGEILRDFFKRRRKK